MYRIALSTVALAAASLTLLVLAALHVASPEFDPSWRMVSEYALGEHRGMLSLFFFAWAVSSLALAVAVLPLVHDWRGRIGVFLLLMSGFGELLAAYFDIRSSVMHGVAALIGIPTLPVAALLVSYSVDVRGSASERRFARLSAHLPWLSLLLMTISMIVFFSTFQQSGGSATAGPPTSLPAGTVAFNGWANRILVVCYCAWVISFAWKLRERNKLSEAV